MERSLALDPSVEFPAVKVIDEKVWKRLFGPKTLDRHGLTFDDAAPLDIRYIISLRVLLRKINFSKIEGTGSNTGVTLLTLPKGLTLNKLLAIGVANSATDSDGEVKKVPFVSLWDRAASVLGNLPLIKTNRMIISNNIIVGSRGKSFATLQSMAKGGDINGKMPGYLSVMALSILSYMMTPPKLLPITLFNDKPAAYQDPRNFIVCAGTLRLSDQGVRRDYHLKIGAALTEMYCPTLTSFDAEGDSIAGGGFMVNI